MTLVIIVIGGIIVLMGEGGPTFSNRPGPTKIYDRACDQLNKTIKRY